jgi:DNA ligase-1
MAWNYELNVPKNFGELQKRLGRKSPSKSILNAHPAVFVLYDILEYQGADLRTKPLKERRQLLQEVFQQFSPKPHTPFPFLLSEVFTVETLEQLSQRRTWAKTQKTEGLMIKNLNSEYGVGRKRGDWWKWKVDPETADAVMIYAQKGHGKRASRYTDFTFALKKGEELVPFAKAYSGLSQKEIEEINVWIKEHTKERFGPVCSVEPLLVFEIAFEGINLSKRHKSGIAVRFPRIVRWRKDKKVSEITQVDELFKQIDKIDTLET